MYYSPFRTSMNPYATPARVRPYQLFGTARHLRAGLGDSSVTFSPTEAAAAGGVITASPSRLPKDDLVDLPASQPGDWAQYTPPPLVAAQGAVQNMDPTLMQAFSNAAASFVSALTGKGNAVIGGTPVAPPPPAPFYAQGWFKVALGVAALGVVGAVIWKR